jgi:plastocyanin
MLYVSIIQSSNRIAHHPHIIPTEPKITQIQAVEAIEQDLHSKFSDIENIKLEMQRYNFSAQEYESGGESKYVDYRAKLGFGWPLSTIKMHPELLNLPLAFIHANRTVYVVNATSHSFEKVCDEPSNTTCPVGRGGENAARDRLFYRTEVAWYSDKNPPSGNDQGFYMIDAETGQVLWNTIDAEKDRKPLPNVNFGNKTISQILKERTNPPLTIPIDIEYGASLADHNKGYLPKEVRGTLGIDNKAVWTNRDTSVHTVVSDTGYSNQYSGKFESGMISPNSTYSYVFMDFGRYPYHCDIHPWMRGMVDIVESFS